LHSLANAPAHLHRRSSRKGSFKDMRFSISQALSYSKEVEEMNKSHDNMLNIPSVSNLKITDDNFCATMLILRLFANINNTSCANM